MGKIRSFRDVLEKYFYNEIYEAVNEFVQDNPGSLDCSTRYVQSPDEAILSDQLFSLVKFMFPLTDNKGV